MDSRAPKQPAGKTDRKKLKLNKETLKDLSASDKEIKGGAPAEHPTLPYSSCERGC